MGSAYLPLDTSWKQYIGEVMVTSYFDVLIGTLLFLTADTEYKYEEMEREIQTQLMFLATEACSYMHDER